MKEPITLRKILAAAGGVAATVVLMAGPASAANFYPAAPSNQAKMCGYATFYGNGLDGAYHRYTYSRSEPIAGGGRSVTWVVANPNNTGGYNTVGYTGRTC